MKKEIERGYSLILVSEKQLANSLGRSFMFGMIDNVIMVKDQFYLKLNRVEKNYPLFKTGVILSSPLYGRDTYFKGYNTNVFFFPYIRLSIPEINR